MEEINTENLENTENEILAEKFKANQPCYFCPNPNCNKIPSILLKGKDRVEISCSCNEKHAEITDKRGEFSIEELIKFKRYTIPLSRFSQELNKQRNIPAKTLYALVFLIIILVIVGVYLYLKKRKQTKKVKGYSKKERLVEPIGTPMVNIG